MSDVIRLSPRRIDGSVLVDHLLPKLVGETKQPSAFLVYLVLWRLTEGGYKTVYITLQAIADRTGVTKRAVQYAIDTLIDRRLIGVWKETQTSVPEYRILHSRAAPEAGPRHVRAVHAPRSRVTGR
jgi:hypothetical protein